MPCHRSCRSARLRRRPRDHRTPHSTTGATTQRQRQSHPYRRAGTRKFRRNRSALAGSAVDYSYETVPQPGTGATAHHRPRGHTLGGSSSINAMVFLRGHAADFNAWTEMGCTGWDYASVLPYFRWMETIEGADPFFRGDGGPMRPAVPTDPNPLSEALVDAAVAAGFARTGDFNGAFAEGVGWHELAVVDGRRQSAADAYLHPIIARRPNLTVLTGARAHRLILKQGRCVGVAFTRDGHTTSAYADYEVVVSAGAVDSPRLLMLSGIGDASELEHLGLPVVQDVPGVGRNLHDHPVVSVVYEATKPIPSGWYNQAEASMLWRSDPRMPGPDMRLVFLHVPSHRPTLHALANSFTFAVSTVPQARGTVRLVSDDPSAPPMIDPNYLAVEADVRRLVDGIEVARTVAAAEPFAVWRGGEVLPGADVRHPAARREYLRWGVGPAHHPVGTCAMGTGPDAVVAPDLRVHGLDGLRVADASVMPRIVSVGPNPATMMIGEKAADLIRTTYF
ncbi:GMC family oxidoreductase [Micromonospora gifhornensis]|nr:GMC family oxidoreductase N-terminal domain-containing protein [Micromonospora gifhornensis]